RALGEPRHEQLRDTGGTQAAHRVDTAVPAVDVAHHADRAGARSPDGKRGAGDAVELSGVSAQHALQLFVPALAGQVEIELSHRGQKRIGVVLDDDLPVRIAQLELVPGRLFEAFERAREQALLVRPAELERIAPLGPDSRPLDAGLEAAEDDAVPGRVRAEIRVRVVMVAREDAGDVAIDLHATPAWRRRSMPRTGIPTQSGRLSSS